MPDLSDPQASTLPPPALPAVHAHATGRLWLTLAMVAAIALIMLSAWRQGWLTPTSDLYLDLPNTSGVQAGTPVKLKGFKIGEVDDIRLQPDLNVRVRLKVVQARLAWLGADASAKFGREGPIGSKYIDVLPGRRDGPRLEADKTLPIDTSSDFEDVMVTVKGAVEKLALALDKVDPILDDTRKVTAEVAGMRATVHTSVDAMLVNLQALTLQMRRVGDTATGMAVNLNQDRAALVGDARSMLKQSEAAAASARVALKSLETELPLVLKNARDISTDARQMIGEARGDVGPLVRSGRTAVEDAAQMTDGLKRSWPLSGLVKTPPDGRLALDGFEGSVP